MKILITGITGFVGPYLSEQLQRRQPSPSIIGTAQQPDETHMAWAQDRDVDLFQLDVRDAAGMEACIRTVEPDRVIHLAAVSHVPTAQQFPVSAWEVNVLGTLNLLEACSALAPDAAVLYVSSGDVYGRTFQQGSPLDEEATPRPENPYSSSKAAAEILVRQYAYQGLHGICLRAFNHVGPGQRPDFVVSAFARQIAEIEAGLREPVLTVGNLDAWRDFTDVRDVVRAYELVVNHASEIKPASIFNVCSGQPRQIRSVLDGLLAASATSIRVEQDPDRLRPSDTPFAAGNPSRLAEVCGWQPLIPWDKTIRDVLDYWRSQVRKTSE